MRKMHFGHLKQTGISLLEVLLSLSIIAIILVMATRYYFVASNNDRVNTARQQIGAIIAAIHAWKDQNPQYNSNLNVSALYRDGSLASSSNLVADGDSATLYDPWGHEIQVTGSDAGATITMNLPKLSDCRALQNSFTDAVCSGSSDQGSFSLEVH